MALRPVVQDGTMAHKRSPLRVPRWVRVGRAAIADLECESDCYVPANIRSLVCTLALLTVLILVVVAVCGWP
jgi:hypothetical protein